MEKRGEKNVEKFPYLGACYRQKPDDFTGIAIYGVYSSIVQENVIVRFCSVHCTNSSGFVQWIIQKPTNVMHHATIVMHHFL